ncbi:MAG: pre-peptidase C-terminal domain-containing protein [Alphaproteobacteria bacterium]
MPDDFSDYLSTSGSVAPAGSINGNIETPLDSDWFRISLTEGVRYLFNLEGADTSRGTLTDPFLKLYFRNGTYAGAFDDDSGPGLNASFAFTPVFSGDYFLEATGVGDGTGTYRLSAALDTVTDDFAASIGTAGNLGVGGSATGNIETSGDVDWFRIVGTAGATYQIDVEGADSGAGSLADPFLRIHLANGTDTGLSDDDSGTGLNASFFLTTTTGGNFFYAVSGFGDNTGTYTISTRIATTATRPNDDFADGVTTTGALAIGGAVTGNIETSSDTDWFRISGTAGTTYQIDVQGADTAQGTLVDPFLSIYNSAGADTELSDDDSGDGLNSSFFLTVTTGGDFYFAVSSYGDGTGTYRLSASAVAADDFADSASTAGLLTIGAATTGNIGAPLGDSAPDLDWFRVNLTAGTRYQFDMEGSDTSGGTLTDSFLTLFNSNGEYAGVYDDDSGSGLNARFLFTPSTSGVYFVEAASANSGMGTYRISAAVSTAPVIVDDFSATAATAGSLIAGNSVSGNIEVSRDTDWFRIQLTEGTRYQFDLEGVDTSSGTLSDPFLSLFNSNGVDTGQSDDDSGAGLNSSLFFTATSTGTYFLAAGAFGEDTGTYRLNTVVVGTSADRDDFAGSTSTTGLLTVGSFVSGTVERPLDSDWFRINLTAGTRYQFDMEGMSSARGTVADPFLRLFNASGTYAGVFTDNGGTGMNSRFVFTPTESGVYYLDATSSDFGSYRLSALALVAQTATDDFAASAGTGGSLVAPGNVSGNVDAMGDRDWFRVNLLGGKSYRFELEGVDTTRGTLADPVLQLFDSNGVFTGAGDDNSGTGLNSAFIFTPTASGVFYLDVTSSGAGTYRLSIGDAAADTGAINKIASILGGIGNLPRYPVADGSVPVIIADPIIGRSSRPASTEAREIITGDDALNMHTIRSARSDFSFASASGTSTITDNTPGRNGVVTLVNVERVQFNDGVMAFDTAPSQTGGQGYLLYRAAFDRTPDAGGLGYWIRELDRGQDYGSVVAASFIASQEFTAKYGTNISNSAFVNLIYQNVLDRAPDADGGGYWLSQLNGGFARSNMLASFAISQENYNNVAPLIRDGFFYE